MASSDLVELTERIRSFAEDRDWFRFHTPKNLSMALIVEAAEIVEHFQWADGGSNLETMTNETHAEVRDEIADVAIYLLRLADVLGIDVGEAVGEKLDVNEERFPVNGSRGEPERDWR